MKWSTGMTWGISLDGIGRPPGLRGGWYDSWVGVEVLESYPEVSRINTVPRPGTGSGERDPDDGVDGITRSSSGSLK
jgi:hypothetical protein